MHGKILSSFQIKIQINIPTNPKSQAKTFFAVFAHLPSCLPPERAGEGEELGVELSAPLPLYNQFFASIQFRERILFSLSLEATGKCKNMKEINGNHHDFQDDKQTWILTDHFLCLFLFT